MSDSMYGLELTIAALTAENERLRAENAHYHNIIGKHEFEVYRLTMQAQQYYEECVRLRR